MELAIAFFGAIGSGGAAAATSAASWLAGTTVTTAAGVTTGLGSSALGVLQGVATAASMASSLVGGVAAFGQAASASEISRLQGEQEYVASEQAALEIKRDLVRKVGAARTAFAASGLDISSAEAVESDLTSQANFATGLEKSNGKLRQAQANAKARQYKMQGFMDLAGAATKAVGQYADYSVDIANRG